MSNDVTVHNNAAGNGTSFVAETYDTGSGHRQVVSLGAAGAKTFSDPAPTTTAAAIVSAGLRFGVSICNAGTQTVYLGKDNTVTSSNGFPLTPGATLSDDSSVDAWWAITATGTGDLRVIVVA